MRFECDQTPESGARIRWWNTMEHWRIAAGYRSNRARTLLTMEKSPMRLLLSIGQQIASLQQLQVHVLLFQSMSGTWLESVSSGRMQIQAGAGSSRSVQVRRCVRSSPLEIGSDSVGVSIVDPMAIGPVERLAKSISKCVCACLFSKSNAPLHFNSDSFLFSLLLELKNQSRPLSFLFRFSLQSMMNDGVSLGEYPRNTYPPSILLDGGVSNGGPAARGAIIRTAAIWARLVTNRYALNLFGTSGGGAFHRAVLLLDRHVIRVTDSSLVVRSLLSEHLVVGEAFYAPLLGIRHSCQPTAAFTFDNTRLQLRSIRPRLLPCDISVNYMDIVGAVHTLCLPADIRRPQLSLRGICCSCDLCRRPDCLLDGPLGSLFNALTRVGSHLFKHVNTQRCALQQLFRLSDQFCPGPHPTLTLMRLRLLYFELIAGCFAGAQTQLCLLLNEAAITHSGEQFDRCRPAFLALQEALQRGLKRDVEHAMEAVFDVKQFIPN